MTTYTPRITKRTRSSFATTDTAAVASLLEQHGYLAIRPRSDYEYGRLVNGGAIAVLYASGSILCQGSRTGPLIALLEQAAEATAVEQAVLL